MSEWANERMGEWANGRMSEWESGWWQLTYEEWQLRVPSAIKREPVWELYGYRKALYLFDRVWEDCGKFMHDQRGRIISDQLIRSSGSISANIEEGHGRGVAGKEYQQFLRYALASARETKGWFYRAKELLSADAVEHRYALTDEVIALLITEIERQRKRLNVARTQT